MSEPKPIAPLEERIDRYNRIVAAYNKGATLKEIGAEEGLTRARVSQIINGGVPAPVGRPREWEPK